MLFIEEKQSAEQLSSEPQDTRSQIPTVFMCVQTLPSQSSNSSQGGRSISLSVCLSAQPESTVVQAVAELARIQ